MKKTIIAAAIVCAAAFANAATATWGIGYINDVNGNLIGESSTGYTAVLNIYSDAALSMLVTSSSSSEWADGMAFGESDDVLVNSPETTYFGQIIISHGADTLKSDGFQFTTSSLSPQSEIYITTTPDDVSGIEKIGGGAFEGTNGAFETSGGAWTTTGGGSVPEPTSGLLMLLGVAGLALKRKRA